MYWNNHSKPKRAQIVRWIVTLDVLKWHKLWWDDDKSRLNSNIRCIEINRFLLAVPRRMGLNSNIRCIEIFQAGVLFWECNQLNSNIRCIEIFEILRACLVFPCWIVTLDVLKSVKRKKEMKKLPRWIVTLDVLKFKTQTKMIAQIHSWIVTLDVLKSQRVLT